MQFSADAAVEPLTDLNAGTAAWQQLLSGQSATTEAAPYIGPRIAIDASNDVTLAWDGAGSGNGESTVNAITANALRRHLRIDFDAGARLAGERGRKAVARGRPQW